MSLQPRKTHKIIVVYRPSLWVMSFFIFFGLILTSIWGAYEYGRQNLAFVPSETQLYIIELEEKLAQALGQNVETQRQATMLERNRQIDDDASDQLKATLLEVQTEVLLLRKELRFYKSIVSPEQGKRNLAIQTIELEANKTGDFRYKIMISQRGQNNKLATGVLNVYVDGKKEGKSESLKLSELSTEMKSKTKFGFKYFQNFEGTIVLPNGFSAEAIHVIVKPRSKKLKPIDEYFSWSELISGGV